jgi:outer membrane protein assembly factor BamA
VQLAAFFDVGGMYQTTGSAAGTRVGSGVGVRFAYGAQVLKFDWAYGIGNGAQERGRGRFYFSISREIPRLIRR